MSTKSTEREAAVLQHLREYPSDGAPKVSAKTGIPEVTVSRILRALRAAGSIPAFVPSGRQPAKDPIETVPTLGEKVDLPPGAKTGTVETAGSRVVTIEELLALCKVDLQVWEVDKVVVNKYEVASKVPETGDVTVTPLFQIKAFLKRKAGAEAADMIRGAIAWVRENSDFVLEKPVCFFNNPLDVDDPHLLEISLPDIHIGKLAWAPESGESYDTLIAPHDAMQAARNLWAKASVFPVRRILLPLGNDFFNVNSAANETAAGTPQNEDGRWQKSFQIGVKLACSIIEFLRGKAAEGIDVVIVPGNHDPERIFYLGEVLGAIYGKTADVRVNNSPNPRKYVRFGTTLLGFTHGHAEKHDKLPLIMAGERPADWAATTHREFHLGHLHHVRETRYAAGIEFGPVRVRVLPSLSPADTWHHTNGYVCSKRAAEAYLWSYKNGYTGHLSWSPPAPAVARAA